MTNALPKDKNLVVDILTASFHDNKSVNYLIPNDSKRVERIRYLMDYSFEVCQLFGKVVISEDRNACALILYPDQKKASLKAFWLDLKLIRRSIGFGNIFKAISKENKIKKLQGKGPMHYLWFIGVSPGHQNFGIGAKLLQEILAESAKDNCLLYLETSASKNVPWYQKFGFQVYDQLNFGYTLFFMKSSA